jgi:hypothetical protein
MTIVTVSHELYLVSSPCTIVVLILLAWATGGSRLQPVAAGQIVLAVTTDPESRLSRSRSLSAVA